MRQALRLNACLLLLIWIRELLAQSYIPVDNSTQARRSGWPCSTQEGFHLPLCHDSWAPREVEYHYNILHHPYSKAHRRDAFVALDVQLLQQTPDFSVVVSIHNQEAILKKNLACILATTMGVWELVLVFDDCSDTSLEVAQRALRQHLLLLMSKEQAVPQLCQDLSTGHLSMALNSTAWGLHEASMVSALTRARLIVQPTSVWESSSDNIGLRSSQPHKYYILIQPDMELREIGYNWRLTVPAELYPDIFAVSGRCAHNTDSAAMVGRCNTDVGAPSSAEARERFRHEVHLRDMSIRGPLAVKADRMVALGFLDEHNFHLGDDDHELCLRAHHTHAWRCSFYAIDFVSPLGDGSTRKSLQLPVEHPSKVTAKLHLEQRLSKANQTSYERLKEQYLKEPSKQEKREVPEEAIISVFTQWHGMVQHRRLPCHVHEQAQCSDSK